MAVQRKEKSLTEEKFYIDKTEELEQASNLESREIREIVHRIVPEYQYKERKRNVS